MTQKRVFKNNVALDSFGATKNAKILSEHLLELGDGFISWKLKKRYHKTMEIISEIRRLPHWRKYLCSLVLQDVDQYLQTMDISHDIRQRFYSVIRNACADLKSSPPRVEKDTRKRTKWGGIVEDHPDEHCPCLAGYESKFCICIGA